MQLKPGTLVVLEGIDKSGKSTQVERLKDIFADDHFAHQPSGGGLVGEAVYKITESKAHMAPLTRQLLHLAAHTEQYERDIIPWLQREGVFLDRCWWSTLAYGWYGSLEYLIDFDEFERLVRLPTQGVTPDAVFVFVHAHERDPHNTAALIDAYWDICQRYPEMVEPIEIGTPEEVTQIILRALERRELLVKQ